MSPEGGGERKLSGEWPPLYVWGRGCEAGPLVVGERPFGGRLSGLVSLSKGLELDLDILPNLKL